MPSYCQQLAEDYKTLMKQKNELVLEYQQTKDSGDLTKATKLKNQLQKTYQEFYEKIHRFISEEKALNELERLLNEGADKDSVAVGLAGLDSPQSWTMRERLLKEGANKGQVALGIFGDYITFVWQLRRKFKMKKTGNFLPFKLLMEI